MEYTNYQINNALNFVRTKCYKNTDLATSEKYRIKLWDVLDLLTQYTSYFPSIYI